MIPVYIGISKRFEAVKGLTEYSIRKNTSADVKIEHLYPEVEEGCTGFSNVRFTIHEGIYLDCDMLVLGDIAELWSYREPGKFVCMQDGSLEVAVISCNHQCKNKLQKGKLPLSAKIPPEWNVTDAYRENGQVKFLDHVPANTKNFHFTALANQPWFYQHPNREAVALYKQYAKGANLEQSYP